MSVRQSVADYLRSRGFEMEADPNGSLHAPLIDNEDGATNLDDVDLGSSSNVPPKQAFNGHIRLKSDKSDTTEDSTVDDEIYMMYPQFDRHNDIEATPFQDHEWLSPKKPSAKAIVFFLYAFDFVFGSFLIARGCTQMQDEYGNLIVSLMLGLLLLGGSVAGICLHTPFCGGFENQALTLFNIAFGFISFAIYYVLSLMLITSMATMISFIGTKLTLSEQFSLCILGFSVSVGEVYKIMYFQYHYYSNEVPARGARTSSRNNNGYVEEVVDGDDIENANAIPSVLFV